MRTKEFRSSDLKRIDAIARPVIISAFKEMGWFYTREDIEEVSSCMHLKVAQNWDRYDETISSSSWFATIARRCAYTYMTKETNWRCHHTGIEMKTADGEYYEVEYSDREASGSYLADARLISRQSVAVIKNAVDSLEPKMAKAVWLKAQGYSLQEIDEIQEGGYGAIKTRVSRGRTQLKDNEGICTMCVEHFGRDYRNAA